MRPPTTIAGTSVNAIGMTRARNGDIAFASLTSEGHWCFQTFVKGYAKCEFRIGPRTMAINMTKLPLVLVSLEYSAHDLSRHMVVRNASKKGRASRPHREVRLILLSMRIDLGSPDRREWNSCSIGRSQTPNSLRADCRTNGSYCACQGLGPAGCNNVGIRWGTGAESASL